MTETWICDICGLKRQDAAIGVHRRDISAQFGLPPGSGHEFVRHCNDNDSCITLARSFSHFKKEGNKIR